MATVATQSSVKVIGANGQISLGKQFAGRQVLVE
jgi:putative transposon-encoded protein